MSIFERYLTLWVAMCIIVGIILGHFLAPMFQAIGAAEIAKVNLPVAALIWLMIIPMLLRIDFAALAGVKEHWRGISGHIVRQLGGEAIFHGPARLDFHRLVISSLSASGSDQQLYCRAYSVGCCPVHSNGFRMEQPFRW